MTAKYLRRSGLSLMILAVAACQAGAPTSPLEEEGAVTKRPAAAAKQVPLEQRLRDAGLEAGTLTLQAQQFQVRDQAGKGIPGATVEVETELLTTDENGVVKVAGQVPEDPGFLLAIVRAPGMVPARVKLIPGFSIKLHAADGLVHRVSAAAGGRFASSDGSIEVSFSPDALDRDAEVRVTRIFNAAPASLKAISPSFDSIADKLADRTSLGHYQYSLDLGGAKIRPGASVRVDFKAEQALADYIKRGVKLDPKGFKLADQFSIGEDGQVRFAMMVPAPPPPPEFSGPAAAAYGLLAAVCSQPNDREDYTETVCTSRSVQNCVERSDGTAAVHDSAINNGHCYYTWQDCSNITITECTQVPRTRYHQSSSINALVRYDSDDSRYAGRVASGAYVTFSHSGTPVRAAGTAAYTAGDGYAWVYGAAGASGSATASMPGDAGSRGTSGYYSVNCSTVNLSIVKRMPQVTFAFDNQGAALSGNFSLSTSHGAQALSGFANQVKAIAMQGATVASEAFSIAVGNQAVGAGQIDYDGASGTIGWNQANTFTMRTWHNARLDATANYVSNDNSVPADQAPPTRWAGQPAAGVNFNFAHNISGSPNKPAGRDVLAFTGVTSASAWGLNGAASTIRATRAANSVSLTGSRTGSVGGAPVVVGINANLPTVNFYVSGDLAQNYIMRYTLTPAGGSPRDLEMRVPANMQFRLPIEEAVNDPRQHTFQISTIITEDGNHAIVMPDGSRNYPALTVNRGADDYSMNLKSELIAAK
ncbi:MAG: hypothetical protein VKS61_15695 [Candidatus Sericytochromatia bacterium]|nr:hypothetical protein [Candidatus Sericytochromatia bacterium]